MRHLVSILSIASLLASAGCFRSTGSEPGPVPWDGGSWDVGPRRDVWIGDWDGGAPDVGPDLDAGSPTGCGADRVEEDPCPMFVCDAPPRWYWNGHECFPIECGACRGDDCETGPFEQEECERLHAECESTICRGTGGTWRFWGETDCGFVCGFPSGDDCVDGPTCDCGVEGTFDPRRGCVSDECFIDPEVPTAEFLCERSGGEWGGFCAHSHCGVQSPLACVGPACHCEWPYVFDERRGCVEGEACFRGEGGCAAPGVLCPRGTTCAESGTCEPVVCPF